MSKHISKLLLRPVALFGLLILLSTCSNSRDGKKTAGDTWRIAVELNDHWGAINAKGQYVLQPVLDHEPYYWNEVFSVRQDYKTHYYDKKGDQMDLGPLEQGGLFSEGMVSFVDPDKRLAGYLNAQGAIVIQAQFDVAFPFHYGHAPVIVEGKMGYIDRSGTFTIPPKLDPETLPAIWGELSPFKEDRKMGFMDTKGKKVIPAIYRVAYPFTEGLALVRLGSGFKFINLQGETGIPGTFIYATPFIDGRTSVLEKKDDFQMKLLDLQGKVTFTGPERTLIGPMIGGLAIAGQEGGIQGYINEKGEMAIVEELDDAGSFFEGAAVVRKGGLFGLIDKQGNYLLDPIFEDVARDVLILGYDYEYYLTASRAMASRGYAVGNIEQIAQDFLEAMARMDYKRAKVFATEDSQEALSMLQTLRESEEPDSPKPIEILSVDEDGRTAAVHYREGDGPEKILSMRQVDGVWRAAFSKEDSAEED